MSAVGQADSTPQAWLVSEHLRLGFSPGALSQTFGLAYFVDALVSLGISLHVKSGLVVALVSLCMPFHEGVLRSQWRHG